MSSNHSGWMLATIALSGVVIALAILLSLSATVVIPPERKYLQRVTPQYANLRLATETWNAPNESFTVKNIHVLWNEKQIWWPSQTANTLCYASWPDEKRILKDLNIFLLTLDLNDADDSNDLIQVRCNKRKHQKGIQLMAVRTKQTIYIYKVDVAPKSKPTLTFIGMQTFALPIRDMIWDQYGQLIVVNHGGLYLSGKIDIQMKNNMTSDLNFDHLIRDAEIESVAAGLDATWLIWNEPSAERWGSIEYDGWKQKYDSTTLIKYEPIAKNSIGFGENITSDESGSRVFVSYVQPFDVIEHYYQGKHIQSIHIRPIPVTSPNPLIGFHMSCYGHYVAISAPGTETDPSGSIYVYTFDHSTNEAVLPQHLMSEYAGMGVQVFMWENALTSQVICLYVSPQASQYGSLVLSASE